MKTCSARANSDSSAQEIARGCFTTNLAIPGLGSVIGGRKIGYLQMVICFAGQAITLVFGLRFIFWVLAHWSEIYHPDAEDPLAGLHELWPHLNWPLLGIFLFAVAWLWALLTSYLLLGEAKQKDGSK